jgi:hypothetical protein
MKNKEQHLYDLEEDLAPWLPRENEMGDILDVAATAVSELDAEIERVENGLRLQDAPTGDDLEEIAYPLSLTIDENETVEKFRSRVLSSFNSLTTHGSPEEILQAASSLLNVEKENIKLENIDGSPNFNIIVPSESIDAEFGSTDEVVDLLLNSTSTTYGINVIESGTLDYISKTEYENSNYDTTAGYGTLDADGNVTSGGTYSDYYEGDE